MVFWARQVSADDIFSFTQPGQPWYAWEWLHGIPMACVHQAGGMQAVVLAAVVLICATKHRNRLWGACGRGGTGLTFPISPARTSSCFLWLWRCRSPKCSTIGDVPLLLPPPKGGFTVRYVDLAGWPQVLSQSTGGAAGYRNVLAHGAPDSPDRVCPRCLSEKGPGGTARIGPCL